MGYLQHAVCKRGFTMVYMGNNAEVADILKLHELILYENRQSWKLYHMRIWPDSWSLPNPTLEGLPNIVQLLIAENNQD